MINLAPAHKQGLNLAHPLLLGAGTVSYGETLPPGIDLARIGGIVVGPIMAASRSGQQGTRLAHLPGGLVLDHGGQNRGVEAAVRRFDRLWASLPCAVIVQVADTESHALSESLDVLNQAQGVDALELLIPDTMPLKKVRGLVQAAHAHCDMPLLVKLPLLRAPLLAPVALDAGAAALVLGEPMQAALTVNRTSPMAPVESAEAEIQIPVVSGRFYGPANFAAVIHALTTVRTRLPQAVLIASSGIHAPHMAQQALALGANAIALDSVVWIDPFAVHAIGDALA